MPIAPSPRSPVTRVLRQIAVCGLFADVVLLVVAMSLGGVEGNAGRAAGAFVALVVLGDRRHGVRHHGLRDQRKETTRAVAGSFPGPADEQRAAAIIDVAFTKRTDGRVLQMPSGIFFTLRRGLIAELRSFFDTIDMIEQLTGRDPIGPCPA